MPPPNCIRQEQPHCGYTGRYLVPVTHNHARTDHADHVIHALQTENKRLVAELNAALASLEIARKNKKSASPVAHHHNNPKPKPVPHVAMNKESRAFLHRVAKATHDGLVAQNKREVRNMFMGDFVNILLDEFNAIMENYGDVAEEFATSPHELERLPVSLNKKIIREWFHVFKNHAVELEMAARQKKGVAKRLEDAIEHLPKKFENADAANKARAARNVVKRAVAIQRKAAKNRLMTIV